MNRTEKQQIIDSLAENIQRAQSMFFADFSGVTVEEVNTLRRECHKSGVTYVVAKNTLFARALEGTTHYESLKQKLVGPTAVAFGFEDPAIPAKIIKKFTDKTNKISVKVCVFENQVFEGKQFDKIATLPSRPEVIAGVLGSLNSPIAGLVYVLDALEKKMQATA